MRESSLSRYEPLVSVLRSFQRTFSRKRRPSEAELRRELETVAKLGPTVLDDLLEAFPQLPSELHRVATYCLTCLGQEPILPGLMGLVQDTRVPDESRWELVQAMVDLGFDLTSEDLSRYFTDFEEGDGPEQDVKAMIDSISADRQAMSHWLAQLQNMKPDIRASLIEDMGSAGPGAIPVLATLIETGDPGLLNPIAVALAATSSTRALPLLRRIRRLAPDLRQAQVAYEVERALLERGTGEADEPAAATPAKGALRQAMVTYVDAGGSRSLVFTSRTGARSRKLDCLYLLLHTVLGVKDSVGQEAILAREHRETLPLLVGDLGGADVPMDYAVDLLRDALHQNRLRDIPASYPMAAWKSTILSGFELTPRPLPGASDPDPGAGPGHAAAVLSGRESGDLMEEPPFAAWVLDIPDRGPARPASRGTRGADRRSGIPAGVFDLIVRHAILPRRELLARSLELNAHLSTHLGRPDHARLCDAVRSVILSGDRDAIARLSFIRRLAEQSWRHHLTAAHEDPGEPGR